jgi:hypothetical protein
MYRHPNGKMPKIIKKTGSLTHLFSTYSIAIAILNKIHRIKIVIKIDSICQYIFVRLFLRTWLLYIHRIVTQQTLMQRQYRLMLLLTPPLYHCTLYVRYKSSTLCSLTINMRRYNSILKLSHHFALTIVSFILYSFND